MFGISAWSSWPEDPCCRCQGSLQPTCPACQLTLMHMILLGSLCLQLWFLPWKSPILNFVDGLSVSLLVMLLAGSLGYADSSGEDAARVLAIFGTVISSLMVVILAGMVTLGLCALCYRSALGSSKELRIMNLGKVPEELQGMKQVPPPGRRSSDFEGFKA